jgi:hypothetical protein
VDERILVFSCGRIARQDNLNAAAFNGSLCFEQRMSPLPALFWFVHFGSFLLGFGGLIEDRRLRRVQDRRIPISGLLSASPVLKIRRFSKMVSVFRMI